MRYFLDTEFFENGKTIELISIGIVSEDGREYYAETLDAMTLAAKSDWLATNVMPHLMGEGRPREMIRRNIIEFVGEKPELWGYYADYDWVVVCQLFGRMIDLPRAWPMFCMDVKQLAMMLGNPKLPRPDGAEHNALSDARWTKKAWEFLEEIRIEGTWR